MVSSPAVLSGYQSGKYLGPVVNGGGSGLCHLQVTQPGQGHSALSESPPFFDRTVEEPQSPEQVLNPLKSPHDGDQEGQ